MFFLCWIVEKPELHTGLTDSLLDETGSWLYFCWSDGSLERAGRRIPPPPQKKEKKKTEKFASCEGNFSLKFSLLHQACQEKEKKKKKEKNETEKDLENLVSVFRLESVRKDFMLRNSL